MALKSKNKVSANFNMSSMTDIVFLLLIFFMLTSTLVTQNALDLLLPKSGNSNTDNQPTTVQIEDIDGKEIPNFYIDADRDNPLDIEELKRVLIDKLTKKEEDDRGIVLEADNTVDIQYVVQVMEIASEKGFKMVLATSQEE
jgi:biopolymer transport protein ExbD